MQATKGERREAKRRKKRYGHKVNGRSVRRLQEIIGEKGRAATKNEGGQRPRD